MAAKATPAGLRGLSSIPVCGEVSAIVGAAQGCLEDIGTLLKVRPWSATAMVWASDGETSAKVKVSLYEDTEGMYAHLSRRTGDGLLSVHVYWELEEALAPFRLDQGARRASEQKESDPHLYRSWPQEDIVRFEEAHAAVRERVCSGDICAEDFQKHVSRVPGKIRRARVGWACLRKVRACELLDQIIREAQAYWACCL